MQGIGFSTTAGGGAYLRGETVEVWVVFDREVTVTGEPQVALTVGSEIRQATYFAGSGSNMSLFRYTVHGADRDADGISIAANALSLNGGSIKASADGTDADLTHEAVAADSTHKVAGSRVTLSATQPYVGVELTARLDDLGDGATDERWQWWRRKAPGGWEEIRGAGAAVYTPVLADVGYSLQARVRYRNAYGEQQAVSEPTEAVDLNVVRRTRMVQLGLVAFGRAVAATAVDAIGDRVAAPPRAAAVNLALDGREMRFAAASDAEAQARLLRNVTEAFGIRVGSDDDVTYRPVAGADLLSDSAFSVAPTDAAGSAWTFWGRGDLNSFAGEEDGFAQDGTVVSGHVGADYRFASGALVGMAASYSRLDLKSKSSDDGDGTLLGDLVAAYPYGAWRPLEWLGLWGMAGYGLGRAELQDVGGTFAGDVGDVTLLLGAVGQRTDLVSLGGLSLALKADGFYSSVNASGKLPQVTADAWRGRVSLEGGVEWQPGDSRVAARVEMGGRVDGGDAAQELGAEAGAELSYAHAFGLSLTARGRTLLVHQDEDLRDWGVSATVRYQVPGPAGEGLAVSLTPEWGRPASGLDALWQDGPAVLSGTPAQAGDESRWLPDSAQAEVSYGVVLVDGTSLLTPFAEVGFQGASARRVRAGTRLAVGDGLRMEAFGERASHAEDSAAAYQFGLTGTLDY